MPYLSLFTFLFVTYFVAAIPFGLVISKIINQKDIREHGSKNIGATNVTRVLGKKYGFITLVLDSLKGAAMVLLARKIFHSFEFLEVFLSLVALTAVIGHVFPIYLKFKGGKGVATTIAVILAINPIIGLFNIASWILIFLLSRISAVASLLSIFLTVLFAVFNSSSINQIILYILLFLIVLYRHKENLVRIKNGAENKI